MKQKDILLFVSVAIFSGVLSVVLSNYLISPKKSLNKKASIVDVISTEFQPPDKKFFNENSIDPTKLITIGDNNPSNPPFSSKN